MPARGKKSCKPRQRLPLIRASWVGAQVYRADCCTAAAVLPFRAGCKAVAGLAAAVAVALPMPKSPQPACPTPYQRPVLLSGSAPTAPPPRCCLQQGVYVTSGSDVERLSAASSPTPTKDVERYKDTKTAVCSGGLAAARCGLHNLASLRILGRSGGSDGRGLIHITALGHKHPLRHAPRGRGERLVQSQAGGLAVGGEGGKRRPGAFLACAAAGRQQQLSPYS